MGLLDIPRDLRDRGTLAPMEWRAIQRHPDLSQRRMQAAGLVAPAA